MAGLLRLAMTAGIGAFGAHMFASRRFQDRLRSDRERVARRQPGASGPLLSGMIEDFARRVLPQGEARPHVGGAVRLRQRGEIRISERVGWANFHAEQVISAVSPEFVWSAQIEANGLRGRVVDTLVEGEARLDARLFGSVPLMRAEGPEILRGELMRYLAELPLCPEALRLNPHLHFTDEAERVRAGVQAPGGQSAAVWLYFDASGDIDRVEIPDRPRSLGKSTKPTPWRGHFRNYKTFGQFRMPSRIEAGWVLPDKGYWPYFRAELEEVSRAG